VDVDRWRYPVFELRITLKVSPRSDHVGIWLFEDVEDDRRFTIERAARFVLRGVDDVGNIPQFIGTAPRSGQVSELEAL
jgi:hypothetical protein